MSTFTGTAASETITPTLVSPTVAVTGSPAKPSDADDIVEAGDGDDVIDSGGGNDVVAGGRGPDDVVLGAGDDRFIWRPGDGDDSIDGGIGFDTFEFNGTDDPTGVVEIYASNGRAWVESGIQTAIDLQQVERVLFRPLRGADAITVRDLGGTDTTQVVIDLAGVAGGTAGDSQVDEVTLDGMADNDNISIVSAGTAITVSGLGMTQATIEHFDVTDELIVRGLVGNDWIDASTLTAASLRLTLDGGVGNDILVGGSGSEEFIGGADNDTVTGRGGNDWIYLEGGDDTVVWAAGDGSDQVQGGLGLDTLEFAGSNDGEQITIAASEHVIGAAVLVSRNIEPATVRMNGVERIDIDALAGADTVTVNWLGSTNVDVLAIDLAGTPNGTTGDGQQDRVTIHGDGRSHTVNVSLQNGAVTVDGLEAIMTIAHADAADELTIATRQGQDVISAAALAAGHVRVSISSGAGADMVTGSAGDDNIEGGAGADQLNGGAGIDTASYAASPTSVLIDLPERAGAQGDAEGDTLLGIENVIGSAFADMLEGDSGANVLTGGAGGDFLIGGGGNDRLEGGQGDEFGIVGGAGTDTAVFTGNRAHYRIELSGGGEVLVTDLRPGRPDGIDPLFEIENLVFADGAFAPVVPLAAVVWRHDEGSVATGSGTLGIASHGYDIRGTGDFDGDGDADILWRGNNGAVVTWEIEDGALMTNHNLAQASASYSIAGTGDFDGDGDADILWRHSSGAVVTWEMENGAFVTNHNLPQASLSYSIAGTGDFDGDGDADILWRGAEGQVVTWEIEDGAFVINHNLPQVSMGYSMAGTGDFDRDGDADILWRHTGGGVVAWEMEGGALATTRNLPHASSRFAITGTGDFDHDGDADILWRSDEGQVVTWTMEAGNFVRSENFGFVGNTWQIRGTGEFDLA